MPSGRSGKTEEIVMPRRNMETDRYCAANKKVVARFYNDDLELSERKISLEGKIVVCYNELIEACPALIENTKNWKRR